MRKVLIIDGCDATGKTSVAKRIATLTGATYVKPFERVDTTLIWLHKNGYYKQFVDLAETMLTHWFTQYPDEDLVLDRGWMTISAIAGSKCSDRFGQDILNVLLVSDMGTLVRRHNDRGEEFCIKFMTNFQSEIKNLAEKFDVFTIDTSKTLVEQVVTMIVEKNDL